MHMMTGSAARAFVFIPWINVRFARSAYLPSTDASPERSCDRRDEPTRLVRHELGPYAFVHMFRHQSSTAC